MRFDRLTVHNVRNLAEIDLNFCAGLNHFYGVNGAGKTAILEAIHLLCRGRSFRSPLIRDVIRSGERHLLVQAVLEDEQRGRVSVGIRRALSGQTELRLDGQNITRISSVAKLTPLQTLLPDVADLVFGSPGNRRSWLDWGMFHVKPDFLSTQRNYMKALKQRNATLRSGNASPQQLDPWNSELLLLADTLTEMRVDYLAQLQPVLQATLAALVPELELRIEYQRGWPADQSLEKLLGERHSGEVKYGVTQWGPHRADVIAQIKGRQASKVLSRGQGKLLATAMKVSQVALLNTLEQRASVFLIDDAGAELDSEHGDRFFKLLHELRCQIISTSVQPPANDCGFPVGEFRMFHVKHGTIADA